MYNFTYKEIIHSDTAKAKGINNEVPKELLDNLMLLSYGIQLIRNVLGIPMKISSGYRCEALNRAVGGANGSYHTKCLAIDFNPIGMNIKEAYNKIANSNIPFDKLILEKNSKGVQWIHVQFSKNPRREYFKLEVK